MKLLILILAGLSAFALGVLAGLIKSRNNTARKADGIQAALSGEYERLSAEYRNFLSYDGSEQI